MQLSFSGQQRETRPRYALIFAPLSLRMNHSPGGLNRPPFFKPILRGFDLDWKSVRSIVQKSCPRSSIILETPWRLNRSNWRIWPGSVRICSRWSVNFNQSWSQIQFNAIQKKKKKKKKKKKGGEGRNRNNPWKSSRILDNPREWHRLRWITSTAMETAIEQTNQVKILKDLGADVNTSHPSKKTHQRMAEDPEEPPDNPEGSLAVNCVFQKLR